MPHQFKLAAAIMVLTALSACTTAANRDEPAPQISTALPAPTPVTPSAPDVVPAPSQTVPGPLLHDIGPAIPDRVYFEYDTADLGPEALAALQRQAAWLQMYPSVTLVIEGHSDERGTREYNLALAARRATAVRIFLMTSGVSAARLETVSYGKERPSCIASGEECWRQNRRAVSTIRSAP